MKTGLHRQNVPLTLVVVGFLTLVGMLLFSFHERNSKEASKRTKARAQVVKASHNQELEKFSLTGFDEKGKKFWNLEGDAAKIDPSQTVYLEENVTLKLRDATIIRTDHVQWSQDGGSMKTDSVVTVDHETTKIKGIGAFGRPNEGFIQLNRNIEMLINVTTRLTCKGPLKIFYKEDKMIFYRNVEITDERGVLTANRMEVLFNPQEKKVKQIVAIGNVIIQRGTDTTHSQRAIYTLETGSVRLEGNPEITLHKESSAFLDATIRN